MTAATFAACLTPPGAAAIAVLAVRGPAAWDVVRRRFAPVSVKPLPAEVPEPSGPFWLGRFGDPVTGADEVVLSVQRRDSPWVELHCHGGRAVVRMLLDTLQADGVEICTWQELERQTAEDPLQAAALIALAECRTARTAAILLDQFHGALGRALQTVDEALERRDTREAERVLSELMRYAGVGRHLTRPWKVVIAGPPNVGKSSLVNALAGYERCVVSPTPGTTRDVVTTDIALDGWLIELDDTAGLRETDHALEQEGILRAIEAGAAADLLIWIFDASTPLVWDDVPSPTPPPLYVINKIDLPATWDLTKAEPALHVSAVTGAGLDALCQKITQALVPHPPSAGQAVPFLPELCDRLFRVWERCAAGDPEGARSSLQQILSTRR
jgi:tRNA modification GTPase